MESQNLNQIAKYGGGWFRVSDNAVHYQPPLKITKNGEVNLPMKFGYAPDLALRLIHVALNRIPGVGFYYGKILMGPNTNGHVRRNCWRQTVQNFEGIGSSRIAYRTKP